MASTLALRGVPAARRAEGPPSCSARASRATAGGARASGRPRRAHAPWHSPTSPPRASTRARAFAVDRGEALGDDDDALAALFLEDTARELGRARDEGGDARGAARACAAARDGDADDIHGDASSSSLSFESPDFFKEDAAAPETSLEKTRAPRARVVPRAHLGEYCTLGVGGRARAVVEVYTADQLAAALRACHARDVPSVVIGKGSNVLFADAGFDGVAIVNRVEFIEEFDDDDATKDDDEHLITHRSRRAPRDASSSSSKKKCEKDETKRRLFRVGGGSPFNVLGASLSRRGWSGLEFAAGVPGTVGGAAFMNAGADGQDTASVLRFVELVSPCGRFRRTARVGVAAARDAATPTDEKMTHPTSDANATEARTTTTLESLALSADTFGYRRSPFMERDETDETDDEKSEADEPPEDEDSVAGWIVVAATFGLTRDGGAASRSRAFMRRRRATQPLAERSVGCLFRNPGPGANSAGAAIDRAGLKNFAVGAARVSSRHANFLVVDQSDARAAGRRATVSKPADASFETDRSDDAKASLARASVDAGHETDAACRGGSRDMEALIAEVKARVLETTGLVLEEEVRRVPFRSRSKSKPRRFLRDGGVGKDAKGPPRKGPR